MIYQSEISSLDIRNQSTSGAEEEGEEEAHAIFRTILTTTQKHMYISYQAPALDSRANLKTI